MGKAANPESFRPAPLGAANHPVLSLLGQLCLRELTETTKGSILGFAWLALGPLLSMALYVLVFGILFGGSFEAGDSETSLHFALGVYIGLSAVNLVNDTIGRSASLIPSRTNFVKRIVFPLELLPLVQLSGTTFKWLINIGLWLIMALALGTLSGQGLAWLPLILPPLLLLSLGLAWAISALSVYFRDIQQLVPLVTQVVFWSSGVFYGAAKLMQHPPAWDILRWNPVLVAIENTRHAVIWQQPVSLEQLAYLWLVGLLAAATGWFLFRRLRAGFAELL